jgi:hypothetical protein
MTAPTSGPSTVRAVGGWLLRLVLAFAALAVVVISLVTGSGTGALTAAGLLLLALGILAVWAPGSPATTFLLLGALAVHLMLGTAAFDVALGLLAALILLVHQLSGICAAIPLAGRVETVALRPALVRYLMATGVVEVGIVVAAIAG